jgi:hypothetical protein
MLIGEFISRMNCGGADCGSLQLETLSEQIPEYLKQAVAAATPLQDELEIQLASEFLSRAMRKQLDPEDMFRITTTSFMDAYNFDIRQLMKSCVHHLLPSGHIIPFSAYNVLYRDGHVELPALVPALAKRADAGMSLVTLQRN